MKTILIQQTPEKFMQNCIFTAVPEMFIVDILIDNNLYQNFFLHHPKYAIFSAKYISNEIVQFCHDYSEQMSVYVYHSLPDTVSLKQILPNSVTHIGYQTEHDIKIENHIINHQLLTYTPQKESNSIVCFLNNLSILPQELEVLLYPNTIIPIKMFDCPKIKHYQNLGMTDERDKATLLKTHQYYLQLDNDTNYTLDAVVCGTIPVGIEELRDGSYKNKTPSNNSTKYDTYQEFIQRLVTL